jgi:hypothetical protein
MTRQDSGLQGLFCPTTAVVARVQGYRTDDITVSTFQSSRSWEELCYILTCHESPIVRHEAAFVCGQILGQGESSFLGVLYAAAFTETSIVGRHEAIEALGQARGHHAERAYAYAIRLKAFHDIERFSHPDVQSTVDDIIPKLEHQLRHIGREAYIEQTRKKWNVI